MIDGDCVIMKNLFFFIFPLAFILGFMPFFFNGNDEQAYTASAQEYTKPAIDDFEKKEYRFDVEEQKFVQRPEPETAELLSFFPFGFIDSATKVLPEGISFIYIK